MWQDASQKSASERIQVLKPNGIWVLHNYLSSEECSDLITYADKNGFTPNVSKLANNSVFAMSNEALAAKLFDRLEQQFPSILPRDMSALYGTKGKDYTLHGLSERM